MEYLEFCVPCVSENRDERGLKYKWGLEAKYKKGYKHLYIYLCLYNQLERINEMLSVLFY